MSKNNELTMGILVYEISETYQNSNQLILQLLQGKFCSNHLGRPFMMQSYLKAIQKAIARVSSPNLIQVIWNRTLVVLSNNKCVLENM